MGLIFTFMQCELENIGATPTDKLPCSKRINSKLVMEYIQGLRKKNFLNLKLVPGHTGIAIRWQTI